MPQCEVVTSFPAQAHERLRYRACARNHRVLYNVAGAGTQGLAELPEGSEMDIVGPLGNTFTLKPEFRRVMVVARGVGLATMAPLLQQAARAGIVLTIVMSARTPEDLMRNAFLARHRC